MQSLDFDSLPPELHQPIFADLAPHDLAQCTLVSRSWSAACTPELWKTLSIITRRAYLRFQSPETQAALVRNAHNVRDLTTIYFPIIENMFRWTSTNGVPSTSENHGNSVNETLTNACICTNLERLDLSRLWRTPFPVGHDCDIESMIYGPPPYSPNLNNEQERMVRQVIQRNPHLRVLIIGGYIKHRTELLATISDATLPHLQDLQLFFGDADLERVIPSLQSAKQFLENCPRNVRKLMVDLEIVIEHDDDLAFAGVMAAFPCTPCLPHKSLELLFLSMLIASEPIFEYFLLPFLQSCSQQSLKTAFVPYIGPEERIRSVISDLGIPLRGKGFHLEDHSHPTDPAAAAVLAAEQNWASISLHGSGNITNDTGIGESQMTAVLLERCENLERLEIYSCEIEISSSQIQQILCSSPCLAHLGATLRQADEIMGRNPKLSAHDAIQKPWTCSRMKQLQLEIGGVPRPDIMIDHAGFPVQGDLFRGTVEESHQVQRRIYEQLARLTNLSGLQLGGELWEPDDVTHHWTYDAENRRRDVDMAFQLNCLEMSLASGLDLLSGLKNMRVLDVSRMAHRIGVPELEWMQRNWPKLERLVGLFDPWYKILQPGVREWLIEEDPIWGSYYFSSYYSFNASGTCGSDVVHGDQE